MRLLCSRSNRPWLWPLALAVAISLASGRSEIATPGIFQIDKVGHFAVFGLLATLVARLQPLRGRAWLAVVLVSLYGISDEWHQSFTPGRDVQVADWVADTLGAAVAVALYAGWPAYRTLLERPVWHKPRIEKAGQVAAVSAQ